MPYTKFENMYMSWRFEGPNLFFIISRRKYRVKETRIMANGTKDIAIVRDKDGEIAIKKRKEGLEDILHIPENDVLVVEFVKDLPKPFVGRYLILEILDDLIPLVKELVFRCSTQKKGDLYDAYLGREYER